jgi:TM2 domain-containing membrane protein YozV
VNPVCPYCRTEIGEGENERLDCPGCATPHHPECFAENGGCTVFGCPKAAADETKISVSGSDLNPAAAPTTMRPLSLAGGLSLFGSVAAPPAQQNIAPAQAASAIPPPPAMGATGVAPPPAPLARNVYVSPQAVRLPLQPGPRNRVTFVLLGVFLGIFGMHNFYAGYNKKAAIQLALTVLTCFYGAVISWIWAIVEVCVISQDAEGEQFA